MKCTECNQEFEESNLIIIKENSYLSQGCTCYGHTIKESTLKKIKEARINDKNNSLS